MRYDKETYERIESYLNGDLTPEENQAFGQLMAKDKAFAAEVEAWILANQAIEASAYNELRQEIQEGIRKYDRQTTIRWKLGSAILLGGLLISGLLLVLKPVPEPSETVVPGQDTIEKKEVPVNADKDTAGSASDDRHILPIPFPDKPVQNLNRNGADADSLLIVLTDSDTVVNKQKNVGEILDFSPEKKAEPVTEVQPENIPAVRMPDCAGFRAELQPDLKPACEGRADGAITFAQSRAEGGQSLYTIRRPGKQPALSYTDLYSGDYTFIVTNQEGCPDTILVYLPGKVCREQNFVLNPDAGETWEVPVSDIEVFDLQIMDMSGRVVFSRVRERRFAWNGVSSQGVVLPSGLYIYLIVLEDRTQRSGQITIIR